MEEEVIIVLTPKKGAQKSADMDSTYELHVIGGELTNKQKRQILRGLIVELKD